MNVENEEIQMLDICLILFFKNLFKFSWRRMKQLWILFFNIFIIVSELGFDSILGDGRDIEFTWQGV